MAEVKVGDRLLLTVPEAARLCRIGDTVAWTLVRSGEWPSVRLGLKGRGRSVRVPVKELERWLATRVEGGAVVPPGAGR